MPATSPSLWSITSVLKPRASPHRRYMRRSIAAQSCASVPPAPAWMSRNALCESISPGNMRLNSRRLTSPSSLRRSASSPPQSRIVLLALASSSSSEASRSPVRSRSSVPTSASSRARSRPSSWARSGVFQILGSSSSRVTSSRRSFRVSYSKIPPEGVRALLQVFDRALQRVHFHCSHRVAGRSASLQGSNRRRDIMPAPRSSP